MTAGDLRERQYRFIGWSGSLVLMALAWLVMSQLAIDRPRQGPPPTETMLNWVRTIVPAPSADRMARIRVRERIRRELSRVEPRPMGSGELAAGRSVPRLREALPQVPERGRRDLTDLPERGGPSSRLLERGGSRTSLTDRDRRLAANDANGSDSRGSGLARGGSAMDLRTEPQARRGGTRVTGDGPRERLAAMSPQDLDPVLGSFMGVKSPRLPGGTLVLGGQPWQVWVSEQGGLTRVLLRRGDELCLLVLSGPTLQVQSFQRGDVTRARGGLVVQSQRSGAGEAAGLREDLLNALEDEG